MIDHLKNDFPIFKNDPDLVYLDSTATSLKPQIVIDKLDEYYQKYSANVLRGIYKISEKATAEYEETRKVVADFIGSQNPAEIIFTRNASESLNLVAATIGRITVDSEDEIITTLMEHHSNFIPWQQLAKQKNATFKVIGITEEGLLEESNLYRSINSRTKIVAITYVSNALGTINPLEKIIKNIKEINDQVIVVVDAAQAAPHMKIDVKQLHADFVAFSSHKMLGPTGIGILWGTYDLLDKMPPYQFGGEMISQVGIEDSVWSKPPHKFEAGTPHIAGAIALKVAIQYLNKIGMNVVRTHEKEITDYALRTIKEEFKDVITIFGPQDTTIRGGILTFTFGTYHPHDVAQILDESNIAIRAGHHCTMPLHTHLKVPATSRASFYIYNTTSDVDKLIEGLHKVQKVLG